MGDSPVFKECLNLLKFEKVTQGVKGEPSVQHKVEFKNQSKLLITNFVTSYNVSSINDRVKVLPYALGILIRMMSQCLDISQCVMKCEDQVILYFEYIERLLLPFRSPVHNGNC